MSIRCPDILQGVTQQILANGYNKCQSKGKGDGVLHSERALQRTSKLHTPLSDGSTEYVAHQLLTQTDPHQTRQIC